MADRLQAFINQFVSSENLVNKKVADNIIRFLKNNKNAILTAVYWRMLKEYMLSTDKKIKMLVTLRDKEQILEIILKEARKDKTFTSYVDAFGADAILQYLSYLDRNKKVEKFFASLLSNPAFAAAVVKNKGVSDMKKELDDFLKSDNLRTVAGDRYDRIEKEISVFKENNFPKTIHTVLACLLTYRTLKNKNSLPALLTDGRPYFKAGKKTAAKETAAAVQPSREQKKIPAPQPPAASSRTTLANEVLEFFTYYIDKIHPNESYQKFVTPKKDYSALRKESLFAKVFIKQKDLVACEKNKLTIINSVLEWLGEKPLKADNHITDKLLNDIKEKAEKKLELGKQSSLELLRKKRTLIT